MRPRFAGAWHNVSADGFRALVSGLNKAAAEGYAPIYFTVTDEAFAVILEQQHQTTKDREVAERSYPRFFQDED